MHFWDRLESGAGTLRGTQEVNSCHLLFLLFVKWLSIPKADNRVTSNTAVAVRMAFHTTIDLPSKV